MERLNSLEGSQGSQSRSAHRVNHLFFTMRKKETRRPVIKLLVLTGDTRLGTNKEHLYCMMCDAKALLIRKRTFLYVVEEKNL